MARAVTSHLSISTFSFHYSNHAPQQRHHQPRNSRWSPRRRRCVLRTPINLSDTHAHLTHFIVLGHHGGHTGRDAAIGAGVVCLSPHCPDDDELTSLVSVLGSRRGGSSPAARKRARFARAPHGRTRGGDARDYYHDHFDHSPEGDGWRQDLGQGCGTSLLSFLCSIIEIFRHQSMWRLARSLTTPPRWRSEK